MKIAPAVPADIGLISALVIDDNAFDRRRFRRIVGETTLDLYLKEVGDVQEFGRLLDEDKFDVIYVDLNLADASGLNLLPIVRSHDVNKEAAMIMVAGNNQAEVALNALRSGFSDYIDKDELSKAALERATINALQKKRLSNAAVAAVAETKSVEAVLRSFSEACSQEMRPMMARMTRQVRQVRSEVEPYGLAESISQIEATCGRMEEFFQDLASLAEEGKLSSVLKDAAQSNGHVGAVSSSFDRLSRGRRAPRVEVKRPSRPLG